MSAAIDALTASIDELLAAVAQREQRTLPPSDVARTNHVTVQGVLDLPPAVGGIRQLADNTYYEFNGLVTDSTTLRYGTDTMLAGRHLGQDGYIYTGAGDAIVATNAPLFMDNLIVVAATGRCINASADINTEMMVRWCGWYGATIGTISGYRVPTLKNIDVGNFGTGLTFTGTSNKILVSASPFRGAGAGAKAIRFDAGLITGIIDLDGNYFKDFDATAVAISVDPAATLQESAAVRGNTFSGVTINLEGITPASEKWDFSTNPGERDSRTVGAISMQGNATETILTQNVWTKVAGTTVAGLLERMTMPQDNRLALGGERSALLSVAVALGVLGTTNNQLCEFLLYKNGVAAVTPPMPTVLTGPGTARADTVTIATLEELDVADYIEVWGRCTSGNNNLTVQSLQMTARG